MSTAVDTQAEGAVEPVLSLQQVTKRYGGTAAVSAVDFDVRPGEVHALLGENGAGKSTLCKLIAGVVTPDEGQIRLSGEARSYSHPSEALRDGISMVYQETSLVPTMTVAQNLELGDEPVLARMRRLNISARQHLQSLNFHVPPTAYVASLSGAQRQMVEIVRALRRDAKLVIFDEPTASLTPEEKEQLFGAIERLKERGVGIVFVSHALEESLQISDRITILRDGKLMGTRPAAELDRAEIVRMMVGRSVEYARPADAAPLPHTGPAVLEVANLTVGTVVKNMSFSAWPGEIVGMAGLVGAGRSETALVVSGALKRNRVGGGRILLEGKPIRYRVPRQAVRDGIIYTTEDRKVNGFFETMSVQANIYLGHLATGTMRFLARRSEQRSVTARFIDRFRIRAVSPTAKVIELSGGNQQKVVLAKSLTHSPKVVIFDEPTRGVDVGAIAEIHALIREFRDAGAAVIVISSYLPEIMALSDRILVARNGRIAAEFRPEEATEERIMFAAVH